MAAYTFLGKDENPKLAEACIQSSSEFGSLSFDFRFRDVLLQLQKGKGINLDPPNSEYYMEAFTRFKLTYRQQGNGSDVVYFDCFDPSNHREHPAFIYQYVYPPITLIFFKGDVGLVNGKLAISRETLHRDVFEPVIKNVRRITLQLLAL